MEKADDIRRNLRAEFEATLEARVQRALELRHHPIIPNHHFTWASTECVAVYRDGHFVAAASQAQAITEGIIRFVCERNGMPTNEAPNELVAKLEQAGIVSADCAAAMQRVLKSFRNDFHHMNPSLSTVPIEAIANRNMKDLAAIEGELFECSFERGKLIVKNPKYWDISEKGTTEVSLRPG